MEISTPPISHFDSGGPGWDISVSVGLPVYKVEELVLRSVALLLHVGPCSRFIR